MIVVNAIFSILPDDPFKTIIDGVVYDVDYLPTLNWFLPFDICADLTLAWLSCILVYYLFVMVKKLVYDFVLQKVLSAVTVGISGLSGLV
jgi:hypothetical protein